MEELQKASAFLENAEFSGLLHFYIPLGDMSLLEFNTPVGCVRIQGPSHKIL